jgi:predicted dehydrogenase
MVEAAKGSNRIVQVGLQRRSSPVFKHLTEVVQKGEIGRVTISRAYRISNMSPNGIGRSKKTDPPPELDWNSWLGPRAWRDYQDNIHPYRFRWWSDYSSQLGNWGVHYFDAIRWLIGEKAPIAVSAHGGRFAVDDDRTIPDTLEVVFEFASGSLLIFGQYEACGVEALPNCEIEIRGTLGNLRVDNAYLETSGYQIVPSRGGQFAPQDPRIEPSSRQFKTGILTTAHVENFLDCLRNGTECNCPLEEGHRSTTFAHLAKVALTTQSRIEWDADKEQITNHKVANQMLHYKYREPWNLG